jgi:hypothetical protein
MITKRNQFVFLLFIFLCSCFNGNRNLNTEIEMIEPEIYAKYLSMVPGNEKPN